MQTENSITQNICDGIEEYRCPNTTEVVRTRGEVRLASLSRGPASPFCSVSGAHRTPCAMGDVDRLRFFFAPPYNTHQNRVDGRAEKMR